MEVDELEVIVDLSDILIHHLGLSLPPLSEESELWHPLCPCKPVQVPRVDSWDVG
jgi:hypothetical protein